MIYELKIPGKVKYFKCIRQGGKNLLEVFMEANEGGSLHYRTTVESSQSVSDLLKLWCNDMSILLNQNLEG